MMAEDSVDKEEQRKKGSGLCVVTWAKQNTITELARRYSPLFERSTAHSAVMFRDLVITP